jgi:hypothetical protein
MDCPISEITYGFAFVANLMRANRGKRSLPFFPTLREEALKGYDVRLKVAGEVRYYQFKRPSVVTWSHAKECQPPFNLTPPFLKIRLTKRPHSEQHNILVDLAAERRHVFYTCTRLYEMEAFRVCYRKNQTHIKSAYINPTDIGRINDHLQHTVAFEPTAKFGWFCSDPLPIGFVRTSSALPSFEDDDGITSLERQVATELEMIENLLNRRGVYYLHSTDPGVYRGLRPLNNLSFCADSSLTSIHCFEV